MVYLCFDNEIEECIKCEFYFEDSLAFEFWCKALECVKNGKFEISIKDFELIKCPIGKWKNDKS